MTVSALKMLEVLLQTFRYLISLTVCLQKFPVVFLRHMFQSENGNIVKTVFLIGLYDDNVYFLFMC